MSTAFAVAAVGPVDDEYVPSAHATVAEVAKELVDMGYAVAQDQLVAKAKGVVEERTVSGRPREWWGQYHIPVETDTRKLWRRAGLKGAPKDSPQMIDVYEALATLGWDAAKSEFGFDDRSAASAAATLVFRLKPTTGASDAVVDELDHFPYYPHPTKTYGAAETEAKKRFAPWLATGTRELEVVAALTHKLDLAAPGTQGRHGAAAIKTDLARRLATGSTADNALPARHEWKDRTATKTGTMRDDKPFYSYENPLYALACRASGQPMLRVEPDKMARFVAVRAAAV